jgi:CheY-like chemotaxis protein
MTTIKILVVDDHGIVREGLKMVLSLESDFAVVGEAGSGKEAVDQALRLRPDVVLMDVLMDEVNGIDACRQIKNALPEIKVLMLTSHDAAQAVEASVLAGASGYLLKNGGREDLLKGIRKRHSHRSARRVAPQPTGDGPSAGAVRQSDPERAGAGNRPAVGAREGSAGAGGPGSDQPANCRRADYQRKHGPQPPQPHSGQAGPEPPLSGRRLRRPARPVAPR